MFHITEKCEVYCSHKCLQWFSGIEFQDKVLSICNLMLNMLNASGWVAQCLDRWEYTCLSRFISANVVLQIRVRFFVNQIHIFEDVSCAFSKVLKGFSPFIDKFQGNVFFGSEVCGNFLPLHELWMSKYLFFFWLSYNRFEEHGPSYVQRKCP